jgi:hypothetical protein
MLLNDVVFHQLKKNLRLYIDYRQPSPVTLVIFTNYMRQSVGNQFPFALSFAIESQQEISILKRTTFRFAHRI